MVCGHVCVFLRMMEDDVMILATVQTYFLFKKNLNASKPSEHHLKWKSVCRFGGEYDVMVCGHVCVFSR